MVDIVLHTTTRWLELSSASTLAGNVEQFTLGLRYIRIKHRLSFTCIDIVSIVNQSRNISDVSARASGQ